MKKVPARGDYVHIDFDPQPGYEQAGQGFGLVLSPVDFNRITGFAWVAPITTQVKGYPFEVQIPRGERCKGAVLIDRIKSPDQKARTACRRYRDCHAENATAFGGGETITITSSTTR